MKFRRRPIESLPVSSASMSDIVFSLLLFFMVSTVIKKYSGLPVQVPAAFNIEKLSTKTHTSYLWIDKQQRIVFDDYPINSMEELYSVARAKIEADHKMLIFLRVDESLTMGALADVQEQLRRAGALRIYYGTNSRSNAIY